MSKISELSDGGSLQSTDYLIAVRSGGNVKVRPNGAVSGTTGTFSDDLNVGSGKLFVDVSAGNVGIGTSSPAAVSGGTALEVSSATGSEVFVTRADTTLTAGDFIGGFGFKNTDADGTPPHYAGFKAFASSTANGAMDLHFYSARSGYEINASAMVLDSTGNLLVANTTPVIFSSSSITGHNIAATGTVQHNASAETVMYLNRLSTDGSILDFRKDGSPVGSIGVNNSNAYISGETRGLNFTGTAGIIPCNESGASRDADTNLGTSSTRFKDLYLSGGVYLGGTGAANLLDDYEEGTWTPVAKSGSTTITTTNNFSTYTKIGRYVFIQGHITRNDAASLTDVLSIVSLPFNTQSGNASVNGSFWVDGTGTDEVCTGYFPSASSSVTLKKVGANSDYVTADQFQNGRPIYFSAAYMTAT